MACGRGEPTAEDCAIHCWSPALGGRREPSGQWRASCPVPSCRSLRSLEYDAPGKHVRWKSFCGLHDKDAVRPYLAKLVGPCMPSGRPAPAMRAELEALALAKLGVGPTHKRRVIEPLRKLGKLPVLVSPGRP